MRVILNLEKTTLDDLQKLADADKRSRKNFMELALLNVASGNNPILERGAIQIQDLTKPTNQVKAAEPAKVKANSVVKIAPQKPQSQTEKRFPDMLDGESIMDYKIRKSEENE